MTKKGLRWFLLVLMVGTLLVFCGVCHAPASSSSGPQVFTYDTFRRLTGSTDATGIQVQYAYDSSCITDLRFVNTATNTELLNTATTCDARGNLTGITGPSGTTSLTVEPATNLLLSVTVPGQYVETWTYDAAGNPSPVVGSRRQSPVSTQCWDGVGKISSVIQRGQSGMYTRT